ncbi:ribulose-phosphate 3-epimerase [Candidatus Carsonella ruddii PV]|uniref:Ribulose-phosphate 3-epimerase n=1 Tax=Carsonella ruddii (strain PV) TaxID=387662 RepID=Q05FR4_CARRP|nr:ribulose-phosphate 3-epimerase [Candidatus Carsonella ruddii PV]
MIQTLLSKIKCYHFDLMEFSYVKNNSFSINEINSILLILSKIMNIKYEVHVMSKYLLLSKIDKNKSINHLENKMYKINNIALSTNFCWNYIKYFNYNNILIMSVIPGFGNQKFLISTLNKVKKKINIDGGVNCYIFKNIKNYFNKIIIGSNIINIKNKLSFYKINFILNEFKI